MSGSPSYKNADAKFIAAFKALPRFPVRRWAFRWRRVRRVFPLCLLVAGGIVSVWSWWAGTAVVVAGSLWHGREWA